MYVTAPAVETGRLKEGLAVVAVWLKEAPSVTVQFQDVMVPFDP